MTLPNGRPHGGIRKGAGRKPNPLRSAKLAAELLERGKKLLGDGNAPQPLDLALALMWDKSQPIELRIDMLKTALPYCSPRLSSVEVSDPNASRMTVIIRDFSDKNAIVNALMPASTIDALPLGTDRAAIAQAVADMDSDDGEDMESDLESDDDS